MGVTLPRVERLWPTSTIVCLGGGPSLTSADVESVRGRARVIAINNAWKLAPWADVLYCCDRQYWDWEQGVPSFPGLKYSIDPAAGTWPGVQVLRNDGPLGLCMDPTGLRTGKNSGYQAINVAVHLGAASVILLGYDMAPAIDGRTHWHPPHPSGPLSPYPQMREAFVSLVEPLEAVGVTVVNCSRWTALQTFPCVPLEDELSRLERAA